MFDITEGGPGAIRIRLTDRATCPVASYATYVEFNCKAVGCGTDIHETPWVTSLAFDIAEGGPLAIFLTDRVPHASVAEHSADMKQKPVELVTCAADIYKNTRIAGLAFNVAEWGPEAIPVDGLCAICCRDRQLLQD